jgi:hypothetical protein
VYKNPQLRQTHRLLCGIVQNQHTWELELERLAIPIVAEVGYSVNVDSIGIFWIGSWFLEHFVGTEICEAFSELREGSGSSLYKQNSWKIYYNNLIVDHLWLNIWWRWVCNITCRCTWRIFGRSLSPWHVFAATLNHLSDFENSPISTWLVARPSLCEMRTWEQICDRRHAWVFVPRST